MPILASRNVLSFAEGRELFAAHVWLIEVSLLINLNKQLVVGYVTIV
jgi:hypothetical protein